MQDQKNRSMTKRNILCIINVYCTLNNTIISCSNLEKKVFFLTSVGILKITGGQKKYSFSSQQVGYFAGKQVFKLGVRYVFVNLKGLSRGKKLVLKGLKISGLRILKIQNATPIVFNGCRSKKLLRQT